MNYLLSKIILIHYIYILINYEKNLAMEIILKFDYYYFDRPLSFDSF